MDNNTGFRIAKPNSYLSLFIESFWFLHNRSDIDKEIVILPDGRIDLILSQSPNMPFQITRSGLETYPERVTLAAGTVLFAVSFKLPAIEYVFHESISKTLNSAENMPPGFWYFHANDLRDFDLFCEKASQKISSCLPKEMDNRKQKLFELIYASKGVMTVKELSEKVFWSSRQINRYFNQQYGISLKAYCNILRFRASLEEIAKSGIAPGLGFSDQSHFIKEIKKFSGVSPKALKQNKNDRFIQFSALAER